MGRSMGGWVGSTWQSGDFVPSQSTTGQGPFNEFLWSGQPAGTIFTLMRWLMAKPASKPAAAKGGRGAAAHTQRGLEPTARKGRLEQEVKQRKGGASPTANVP